MMQEEQKKLRKMLEQYQDSDPKVIAKERADIKFFLQQANRWTDNVFAFRSWLREKFSITEAVVNQNFGIPEELDYPQETK